MRLNWLYIPYTGPLFAAPGESTALNIHFSGTITASRTCYLDPETTNINLEFNPVFTRELLTNAQTTGTAFTINLLNCDTELGNEAIFVFSGKESRINPGFIVPENNTPDRGIVIGLETPDGHQVKFNTPVAGHQLTDGNNHMSLNAFIKATPDAIASQTVRSGEFSAISTFTVEYQ